MSALRVLKGAAGADERRFCKSRYARACVEDLRKTDSHSTLAPEAPRAAIVVPLELRYRAIAGRCSKIELHAVWSSLLLGRVRDLEPHLVPIAVEIEALRDELRAANVVRDRADAR